MLTELCFLDKGPSHPLHVEGVGGLYGVFYNSWDGRRHIAFYIPYRVLPARTLCGANHANFVSTRMQDDLCQACMEKLQAIVSERP
jgi:hypothetical protein